MVRSPTLSLHFVPPSSSALSIGVLRSPEPSKSSVRRAFARWCGAGRRRGMGIGSAWGQARLKLGARVCRGDQPSALARSRFLLLLLLLLVLQALPPSVIVVWASGLLCSGFLMGVWGDSFNAESSQSTSVSAIVEADAKLNDRLEDTPHEASGPAKKFDQEADKPRDKVLKRLAQNREAARKSRLKKKAYIQQLESNRVKLSQLENEVEQARQQVFNPKLENNGTDVPNEKKGVYRGGNMGDSVLGLSATINSGIAAFEMEYGHWVEEQNRQICELRAALQAHISDIELRILVESVINHYDELFRMKAIAAKADVFYLMSGMWKTSAERFFLWIGGFRPSELLKIAVLTL
ncbi:hypothetical protein Taro_044085 [Colocasia esculenta]|uniref:DOG1 domain-containing protein n=1 Tax=Colocasia esculenta TaxID=4460 RepID=A0A843X4Z5_COLES|nr:hypothetical protein [Colocasia esculenta]